ncbi:alginate O-acetyltransferase [Dokdonia pacifica]|uniref:D-alanyl-lipoteichoic acid acyltransferase DltB, MBOAT superfamily n=1 Tax=Dokdonia pacifica TaxID=1627892 RepID=A0A238WF00_9FLAO|nr:MBOAT family O-acyltransferase [Dokdonia pacifica]GGG20752.1 alginate O-acetyltransferase [Dokdonia pacifica]SNR45150.1 D-alanyl-lipoteichoic acid acyltransferase DltB, MBOAT superfamily [Dokdonia pacifica]
MFFNSIDFAIFFPIVLTLYWMVSKQLTLRNIVLLLASYVFYGWWDWRFLLLIVISSAVDFSVGKKIAATEKRTTRKAWLIVSLCVNIGLLAYFKYVNFFITSFIDGFRLLGAELDITPLSIILPVGISFYTFQTLSYTIDIYRKKIQPTENVLSFFTFVAFFPQLVAGPIERASHLLPQFQKTHLLVYEQVKSGLLLVGFGLFKKMVIADRAAVLVNTVYESPSDYKGLEVIIATILFAFQIYCDFSGYTDIARGTARMMGFDLMKNFNAPYFSRSITMFWHRWHISLSTWFRDYVYFPLGGNKKGHYRTYLNLFIVFVVSGLWHGAAITFLIWGAIHGIIIVIEKAIRNTISQDFIDKKSNYLSKFLLGTMTFTVVCFAWIFFRAETVTDAIIMIENLCKPADTFLFSEKGDTLGLDRTHMMVLWIAIIGLLALEYIGHYKNVYKILQKQHSIIRWSVYVISVYILIIYGYYGYEDRSQFIYFQF